MKADPSHQFVPYNGQYDIILGSRAYHLVQEIVQPVSIQVKDSGYLQRLALYGRASKLLDCPIIYTGMIALSTLELRPTLFLTNGLSRGSIVTH